MKKGSSPSEIVFEFHRINLPLTLGTPSFQTLIKC
jgi:hypothetical protein